MEKKSKGFTLVELVVVAFIISLLTAMILVNYRSKEKHSALLRSAHKLAQDLRRAQEMAMAVAETPAEFGERVFPEGGYGIYFKIDPTLAQGYQIILFADCDNEKDFDTWGPFSCGEANPGSGNSRNEIIAEIFLERGVKIKGLSPASPLIITFFPPDPEIYISGGSQAFIILSLKEREDITKTVTINSAGLIDTW